MPCPTINSTKSTTTIPFEQRDNTGSLFKNKRKETDKHPDYTGTCVINGTAYWMNAWIKEGNAGKFFSFSFKRKEAKPSASTPASESTEETKDDVPF